MWAALICADWLNIKCSVYDEARTDRRQIFSDLHTRSLPFAAPNIWRIVKGHAGFGPWALTLLKTHVFFPQFSLNQPRALVSSFKMSIIQASFCAPSMNSDRDIWPVNEEEEEEEEKESLNEFLHQPLSLSPSLSLTTDRLNLATV